MIGAESGQNRRGKEEKIVRGERVDIQADFSTETRTWRPTHWDAIELEQKPDAVFLRAYTQIVAALPEIAQITPDALNIRLRVEKYGIRKQPVDYQRDYLAFNQAYFFRNFYKCLCLVSAVPELSTLREIADLGCGAGPFGLAVRLLSDTLDHITFIDESRGQLRLARRIFDIASGGSRVDLANGRLFALVPPLGTCRIASYWLCEGHFFARAHHSEMRHLCGSGAMLLDYRDVLEEFATHLDPSKYKHKLIAVSSRPSQEVASILEKDNVSIYGLRVAPRYVS